MGRVSGMRSFLQGWSGLTLFGVVIAILIAVPVLSVFSNVVVGGTSDTWSHMAQTVLPEFIRNTIVMCIGVGLGVSSIGITAAWLTTMLDFPGRRFFEWALVLPLAVPAYVMAYVYTDFLQFVGPVQTGLRETFGWQAGDYWFPDVRSVGGAIAMFMFVLYPYVYLLARTAFLERASGMLEAGRSLGLGPWRCFFQVSLPLARPALVAGTALALMETLADYGTVAYFGVQTFTTGIYRAWFSLGDRTAAAQLAAVLLGFVVLVLVLEHASRGRARFNNTSRQPGAPARIRLVGGRAWIATFACFMPLLLGFLLPGGLLLDMAFSAGDAQFGPRFITLARNSFVLASVTAVLAVAIAVLLAYAARLARSTVPSAANRPSRSKPTDASAPVAEVGGTAITLRQFAEFLDGLPAEEKKMAGTREGKLALLQNFVAIDLIVNAARRQGLDRDRKVVDLVSRFEKNVLAQAYVSSELGENLTMTPSDVRLYYEANKQKYEDRPFEEVQEKVIGDFQQQKYQEAISIMFERLSKADNVVLHPQNIED